MRKRIIPSIIARNQEELEEKLQAYKNNTQMVQLDVMDGVFVGNKSLWFTMKLPKSTLKYEAHLMVNNPKRWIEKYGTKMEVIIFHFETTKNHHEIIRLIQKKKKKVGVAINPETPIKKLIGIIDYVDQVTIMTVHPGKYGAKYLPNMLEKVRELRKKCPKLDIEVDGGMNEKNIKEAKKAGANKFITGSWLQKQSSIREGLKKLHKLIK